MNKSLLDTDILSEIMRGRDPKVVAKAQEYLIAYSLFTVSVISIMEIVRGYQRVQRQDKLNQFLHAAAAMEILLLDTEAAILAGQIDGDLSRIGQRVGRADPMIAALAITNNLVLISGNTQHYQRIQLLGYPLLLENWRDTTE